VQKVTGSIAGSERHLLQLLPALVERGIEVKMLVLGAGSFDLFVKTIRQRGIEVSSLPAGHDANPLLLWRLLKEIERWSPDIVHTHLIHADLYGQIAARSRGVTGVSSVHGTHPFYRREPGRSVARLAGHLATRTIAISRYAGDFVCEMGIAPAERVRVIHYGVDPSRWLGSKEDRAERRRALCLEPDDIAVGVASRLVPGKGHDVAVRAFAAVAERLPRTRLLIAGDGPLRAEVEEMARRNLPSRQVSVLGFVEDIRGFFGACDLVLFPSLPSFGEGFGLAALEAMAAGVPVVASDAGPSPEVVSDGESGLIVAAGDDQAWTQAIVALASDRSLRLHLGNGARARACREFSVENMADRTVAVYREVVSERGRPVIASRRRVRPTSRSAAGHHAAKRWSSRPASFPVRRLVRQQLGGGPATPGVDRASGEAKAYDMPRNEVGATDPTVS
jgi:glycosyltransferase involved in cell wall biosynthesis